MIIMVPHIGVGKKQKLMWHSIILIVWELNLLALIICRYTNIVLSSK